MMMCCFARDEVDTLWCLWEMLQQFCDLMELHLSANKQHLYIQVLLQRRCIGPGNGSCKRQLVCFVFGISTGRGNAKYVDYALWMETIMRNIDLCPTKKLLRAKRIILIKIVV